MTYYPHPARKVKPYRKDQALVLYCSCPHENNNAGTALKMQEEGSENVFALKGGWKEWQEAGLSMEPI